MVIPTTSKEFIIGNRKGIIVKDDGTFSSETDSFIILRSSKTQYLTIDDYIKGSTYTTSKKNRKESLDNIYPMVISGKNLRVEIIKNISSEKYAFIYNNVYYSIGINSASVMEYNLDKKYFADFFATFTFLKS